MNIDFQEILKELEFRVPNGIINLNENSQVTTLVEILRENGVDDANEYAQRARVVFNYVNEASKKVTPKKKPVARVTSNKTLVVNKKTGNVYPVSNFDSSKHTKATPKDIQNAKDNGQLGKKEPAASVVKSTKSQSKKSPVKVKIDPTSAEKKKQKTNDGIKTADIKNITSVNRAYKELDKKEKAVADSLFSDIEKFYATSNNDTRSKIANSMIQKYELAASDNKQKCYIGVFGKNPRKRKMLGDTPGGFASKFVADIESATGEQLGETNAAQKLTTAAKPDLTDKSSAKNDQFVAGIFKTEPLSYLDSKFYELHGPLDKEGKLIGPSGGKNAKEYFSHSIAKNKSLDNTVKVAREMEKTGELKPGLSKAIEEHKKEMERINKKMQIPSAEAAQAVGNSYAKMAQTLATVADEKTTGAIMKQFAEMALYDTEIANGDECYLPSAGNFPSGDKIKITRKGTKIERVASVSVKYGLTGGEFGNYGFPGETAQYQGYHPNPEYRDRNNSHPGVDGYTMGIKDNLVTDPKKFSTMVKESGFIDVIEGGKNGAAQLYKLANKQKEEIEKFKKKNNIKNLADMGPYFKDIKAINDKYAVGLKKLIKVDKFNEKFGEDNASVMLGGCMNFLTAMSFSGTLNTSNGLSVIHHNHQNIDKNGTYHSSTDVGQPDLKLWKMTFRGFDKRGGGLIASFNSARKNMALKKNKKK